MRSLILTQWLLCGMMQPKGRRGSRRRSQNHRASRNFASLLRGGVEHQVLSDGCMKYYSSTPEGFITIHDSSSGAMGGLAANQIAITFGVLASSTALHHPHTCSSRQHILKWTRGQDYEKADARYHCIGYSNPNSGSSRNVTSVSTSETSLGRTGKLVHASPSCTLRA